MLRYYIERNNWWTNIYGSYPLVKLQTILKNCGADKITVEYKNNYAPSGVVVFSAEPSDLKRIDAQFDKLFGSHFSCIIKPYKGNCLNLPTSKELSACLTKLMTKPKELRYITIDFGRSANQLNDVLLVDVNPPAKQLLIAQKIQGEIREYPIDYKKIIILTF